MKLSNNKKLVIIDGNAIIHRAYHALPPLTDNQGRLVNAVYGFSSMLLKVIQDLQPDYLAVCFDVKGETFRHQVYKDYKATRIKPDQDLYDQIPIIHEIVKIFQIKIFKKTGYEADDIIGTLVNQTDDDLEKIIVTGDMDLLQLVNDQKKIRVYALKKGFSDFSFFDEQAVKNKYGFGPEYIVTYKSLKGDSSDNIPGVSGIGDKTATELILKIGDLKEILRQLKIEDSKLRREFKIRIIEKIINEKKRAELSYELATIIQNVPDIKLDLKSCQFKNINWSMVEIKFKDLGFYSLLKRLPNRIKTSNAKINTNKQDLEINIIKNVDFEKKIVKLESYIKTIIFKPIIINKKNIAGYLFVNSHIAWYFVWSELNKKQQEKLIKLIGEIKCLVGYELKKVIKDLWNFNLKTPTSLFDVKIAAHILNSNWRNLDLKTLVFQELKQDLPLGSEQSALFGLDPKIEAKKMFLVWNLFKKYKQKLEIEGDLGLFNKVEMKLVPVLAKMELAGIKIDLKVLKLLSIDIAKELDRLTKLIWQQAKTEFNIASSVQLREILFEKLKLPTKGIKKGKTGYSTAAPELEKLIDKHQIIPLIMEYRELEKLRNTYVDVLPTLINPQTKRIHTTFNQTATTTGRLSSSDPNLQNIPIRTELGKEIRKAFVAETDNVLISADYSQVELRIIASLSKDKKMIEIFKQGKDIHTATAAKIHGVSIDKVTKEMRQAAKAINFGILYGMGAYGLSWRAGITQKQAKEFINKYFQSFPAVKRYIDQTIEFAHQEGYVETLFGRRRYLPELFADNYQARSSAERMAINMPIQGTAADIIKMAMIKIDQELVSQDCQLLLQVHDELVLEVKKDKAEKIAKKVKNIMENIVILDVPIEAIVHIGQNLGVLK